MTREHPELASEKVDGLLFRKGMRPRILAAFYDLGVEVLADVEKYREEDFLRHPNLGRKSLAEIKWWASGAGLELGSRWEPKPKPPTKSIPLYLFDENGCAHANPEVLERCD